MEGTQKVPIPGDMPILGRLFTINRTDTHRFALVIVITPKLVQGPNDDVPAPSQGRSLQPAPPILRKRPNEGP